LQVVPSLPAFQPVEVIAPRDMHVPHGKMKMTPVRTVFLKSMGQQLAKLKTATAPPIPWGSVKPAKSVIDAADFPTLPKRFSKSGKLVKCRRESSTDQNMSSSIVIDLPPEDCKP
jgi:hypothetical protein